RSRYKRSSLRIRSSSSTTRIRFSLSMVSPHGNGPLCVRMKTGKHQIDCDEIKHENHKPADGQPGRLQTEPAPVQAQMQIGRVKEPRNQGPHFLRIPTPEAPPGI